MDVDMDGKFHIHGKPQILYKRFKPCPHCRRKVRLSQKTAIVAVFCDSVDRAFEIILLTYFYLQRMARHENTQGDAFNNFVLLSIYKLSFFIIITVIGLNLILGIIIDTFSELRDKKVSKLLTLVFYFRFVHTIYYSTAVNL